MSDPHVHIDALVRRFGSFRAVDGVSFQVQRGEVVGFLGPNGAGKSTTMKMLTGYLRPSAGTARIMGRDVWKTLQHSKAKVGYLPEGAPAYAEMTPSGFLTFCARARGMSGRAARKGVEQAAQRAGITHMMRQPIDTLSKGYKRRVGLAQAILHDPPVLVLDEPTDGLDPNQKAHVRDLIREMAPEKAVLLSTHILEEVDAICSRVVLIASGRVLADEPPSVLRARDPRHHAVVLECVAPIEALGADLEAIAGVHSVECTTLHEGAVRAQVTPDAGAPIADRVASVCRERDWAIRSLAVERGSLDRVFRDLTEHAS